MTSKVESISVPEVYRPAPTGGEASSTFPATYRIAAAAQLLKSTGQYGRFAALSQKNDTDAAVALSDMVLARHDLLEKLRAGEDIDQQQFDSLTQTLADNGIRLDTSHVQKPSATLAELESPPKLTARPSAKKTVSTPQTPSDMDEMVVDLRYGRMILSPAIMVYGNETRAFLPLVQISRILDFNISARDDTGKITGWFLDEDRTLEFDPATGTGSVEGRSIALEADQYCVKDEGVYVDARVLSHWFPVDFSYDFSDQSVGITPREPLPFQERLAREKMMGQIRRVGTAEPSLPLKQPVYQFIDPMFMDFGFSGNYENSNKTSSKDEGRFYFLGRGDLAFMNAEIYATGDQDDHLNNTRLTLMREDPRGTLLGPLQATKVSVGDIRTPSYPVVGGGKFERGAFVGNVPLNATGEYDTTFFTGSLAPGWDAQLFRNGVLIDSQRVGSDGRYSFEEVPLYYGTNEFTFKFYGPQGQEQEKTEQVVVGSSMMKPGKAEYQISVTQKDETLYDPLDRPYTMDKDTGRFIGRLRYGAGKNLSVQGGIQTQTIDGNQHDYINVGVQGVVNDTFLSADAIKDLAGGTALELLGQKKAGPLDLKVKQQFFDGFTREGETDLSNKIQSQTEVSAFGTLKGNDTLPDLPYSASLKHTKRKDTEAWSAGTRIAAGFKNTYVNNSLNWKKDTALTDPSTVQGSADLTSNIAKLRLRGSMAYDLYPEAKITQSKVSGLYALNRELSSEVAVSHNAENDDLVTGSFGLNWNNKKYILSPSLSYDSNNVMTAFLSFSTSFGMDKRSGKAKFTSVREADQGAVSARVFHDKNNNQVFDEGDTPISGAEVSADQVYKSAKTDEDGIAFLTGLNKHRQTDITLKRDSLEDPFWEPAVKGNSVLPRPGHVEVIDIPVITTGEIDGTLYLDSPQKGKKTLNHAPIQLLDRSGKVIQEVKSEYDGFYLFMKVPPGDYSVRLTPEFAKNLGVETARAVPVAIASDGTVISGHDLVFAPARPDTSKTAIRDREQPVSDPTPILRWEPGAVPPSAQTLPEAPHPPSIPAASISSSGAMAPAPAADPAPPKKLSATMPSSRAASPAAPETIQAPEPARSTVQDISKRFGLHIASYKSLAAALKGIGYQRAKHDSLSDAPFTIRKTDLGPKGTWYRIFAGAGRDKDQIRAMGRGLTSPPPYTRILDLEGGAAIHMASYRTEASALKGIRRLKAAYPGLLKQRELTTRTVDLGPEKGIWHRVMVTGLSNRKEANTLSEQLKGYRSDSAPMAMEARKGQTVHTASYRTMDKALAHLKALAGDLGQVLPEQVSVRPVDLGKRGTWYRVILGDFQGPGQAAPLVSALRARGDYARVLPLSGN